MGFPERRGCFLLVVIVRAGPSPGKKDWGM